jgi:hypothetical protein
MRSMLIFSARMSYIRERSILKVYTWESNSSFRSFKRRVRSSKTPLRFSSFFRTRGILEVFKYFTVFFDTLLETFHGFSLLISYHFSFLMVIFYSLGYQTLATSVKISLRARNKRTIEGFLLVFFGDFILCLSKFPFLILLVATHPDQFFLPFLKIVQVPLFNLFMMLFFALFELKLPLRQCLLQFRSLLFD